MKKSLVALAVLAASGAAMAQSSVTLYGVVDTWAASVKKENLVVGSPTATNPQIGQGNSLTQTVLNAGGNNGTRWGLKGAEDLGGGLSAIFQLEAGVNHDVGSAGQGGLAFGRHAWAGFQGSFGAVRFGRMPTAFDDAQGLSDSGWDGTFAAAQNVFRTVGNSGGVLGADGAAAVGYTIRSNNTIKFTSNTYSGFAAAVSYALGEDKTLTTDATSITAINATYANGPLGVQVAYQVEDIVNTVALPADKKYTRVGANYTFGNLVAKFTYGKMNNVANVDGGDTTEYHIGADYNLSPAVQLTAGYAKSDDNAKLGDAKRTAYSIGAKYTLSKTANIYGAYVAGKQETPGVSQDAKGSALVVGFQKWF